VITVDSTIQAYNQEK